MRVTVILDRKIVGRVKSRSEAMKLIAVREQVKRVDLSPLVRLDENTEEQYATVNGHKYRVNVST